MNITADSLEEEKNRRVDILDGLLSGWNEGCAWEVSERYGNWVELFQFLFLFV